MSTISNEELVSRDWFRKPENIPAQDLAEAKAAAREGNPDATTFEWRLRNYTLWRCGYGAAVRMWRTNFMVSHEEALKLMRTLCACDHNYETVSSRRDENPVLGTWTAYATRRCTKCGDEETVVTGRKNYSGD